MRTARSSLVRRSESLIASTRGWMIPAHLFCDSSKRFRTSEPLLSQFFTASSSSCGGTTRWPSPASGDDIRWFNSFRGNVLRDDAPPSAPEGSIYLTQSASPSKFLDWVFRSAHVLQARPHELPGILTLCVRSRFNYLNFIRLMSAAAAVGLAAVFPGESGPGTAVTTRTTRAGLPVPVPAVLNVTMNGGGISGRNRPRLWRIQLATSASRF